jgi:hypothetical protein
VQNERAGLRALTRLALLPQLIAQLGPILLAELARGLVATPGLLLRLERGTQISPTALRIVCRMAC